VGTDPATGWTPSRLAIGLRDAGDTRVVVGSCTRRQGFEQTLATHRLHQATRKLVSERNEGLVLEGRHQDNRRGRIECSQCARRLQPVHAGDLDIEQHQIDALRSAELDRLQTVGRLAGQGVAPVDVGEQQRPKPFACLCFIVDDQDVHNLFHGLGQDRVDNGVSSVEQEVLQDARIATGKAHCRLTVHRRRCSLLKIAYEHFTRI
jgi:hypothetical protein